MKDTYLNGQLVLLFTACFVAGCALNPPQRPDLISSRHHAQAHARYLQEAQLAVQDLESLGAFYHDAWFEKEGRKLLESAIPREIFLDNRRLVFHLVRSPSVNAGTYYSGDILINSGLIASCSHADQLRFVAAHEVAHLLNFDGFYGRQRNEDLTWSYQVLDTILYTSTRGTSYWLKNLSSSTLALGYGASVMSYSQSEEHRADNDALSYALANGLDVSRAGEIMLIFEEEGKNLATQFYPRFLRSHPNPKKRRIVLEERLQQIGVTPTKTISFDSTFVLNTRDIRLENARLAIILSQEFQAIRAVDLLLRADSQDNAAWVIRADALSSLSTKVEHTKKVVSSDYWKKLFDKRSDEEVRIFLKDEAEKIYRKVITIQPNLPQAHRGLGLLLAEHSKSVNERDAAMSELARYLELSPLAFDKRYINNALENLLKMQDESNKKPS